VNRLNLYFFTSHKHDLVDSELQDVLESHIAAEEEVVALLQQFAKVNQLNLYFSLHINLSLECHYS
jgi:hypothetical protein